MKLSKSNIAKGVLSIIGVIILGALGSGMWESILKPMFATTHNLLLDVTTFGVNRYRNDIYCEIAKGFCETPSVSLLCLAISTFLGFTIAVTTTGFIVSSLKKVASSEKSRKILIYVLVLYIIFFSVFAGFYATRVSYINSAVTYFQQLRAIISPYIKQQEENLIASKFYQIWSKDDYVTLVLNMEKIALKNGQRIPKFKIW